jgi:uncharacterized protein (DUF885 family)
VTPSADLAALADEFWQGFIAREPIFATQLGDRRFDDRLPSATPEAVADHRRWLAAMRDRVEQVDTPGLDPGDTITRSELLGEIERQAAALAHDLEAWTVDPLEGPAIQVLELESLQPIRTPDEGRALVARWRAIPGWLDEHVANLRRGLADGRTAVRTPVVKAIDGIDAALAPRAEDFAPLAPARLPHDDWPASDLDAFRHDVAAAAEDDVRPALERLRTFLADEVLPAARSDDRPGIAHLPDGAATYRDLILVHTSLPLSPEELHATGLSELERIDAELEALGARVLGTRSRQATVEALRSDPALHFSTREEVRAKAEEALDRARRAIPEWFGRLPKAPCVVVPMAPYEEANSTIAYYRQPATDGSRPGEYYINTSEPETRPRYEAEALAYHESIPGHHLQIAIGQELEGIPEFRRHLGPTAFFEGWGLYTERLADEMSLYSGALDRFGILSFDAWRACRLVVDTGMHALGWTRQQAIDLMVEHTALGPNNIANEVDRYITWPGQALAYKTGQLEILRVRAMAERALGPRFEIRSFHDAALGSGAVSLPTLAAQIEAWVAERRPGGEQPAA